MNRKRVFRKKITIRDMGSKRDTLWDKIVLAIIVAVFSIIGSFLATYLSKNIEENVWVRNETYEYRKTIFFKRIDIYDQTTRIIARRGIAKALSESLDLYPLIILTNVDGTSSSELRMEIRDMKTSLDELTVEYTASATLASTFFGPKTRAAAKDIQETHNPDWWNADNEQYFALLNAMNSELNYGFEYINLNVFIQDLPSKP